MPITKNELKQIASNAWVESYKNLHWSKHYSVINKHYSVIIKGDNESIYNFLEKYAQEMNDRDDNVDYFFNVENCDDNTFDFYIEEKERCEPYLDPEDNDDDEDIIADDASVIEPDNPAENDSEWCRIRERLMKSNYGDFWATDHLLLAMNWGNCQMEGKHNKTTDEEWKQWLQYDLSGSDTQETCYKIYSNYLKDCPERLAIYWSLESSQ